MQKFNNVQILSAGVDKDLTAAFEQGSRLYELVMKRGYADIGEQELFVFIDDALGKLNDEGLLQLVQDEQKNIPTDCFIDLAYKPSYALAALAVYAAVTYSERFKEKDRDKAISRLLQACSRRRLRDHGYEAESGRLENLLLFVKAPLKQFLSAYRSLAPAFSRMMDEAITEISKALKENAEDKIDISVKGFGQVTVTSKYKQIMAAYDGYSYTVFVYGTLMQGQRANEMLAACMVVTLALRVMLIMTWAVILELKSR